MSDVNKPLNHSSHQPTTNGLWHRCWHWPDKFRWLDPLPSAHRPWLLIISLFIIAVLLWPAEKPAINVTSEARTVVLQAELVEPSQLANVIPAQPQEPSQEPEIDTEDESAEGWRTLEIKQGQSLAQLFRDNSLQANDAFALAKAEGDGKPLSNLQPGQKIKVQLDNQGKVQSVDIELPNKKQLFFTRQPDGSFLAL